MLHMLDVEGIDITGKTCVVLGRSNIVGRPMSELLLRRNGTVTVCHSRSRDVPAIVRTADILICAVGEPNMVRKDWIKPGGVCLVFCPGRASVTHHWWLLPRTTLADLWLVLSFQERW